MEFKRPSLVPQDLQLIQDLVGELKPPEQLKERAVKSIAGETLAAQRDEDDASSEKEVEDDILRAPDDEDEEVPLPSPSSGSSDDDLSSDSDSDTDSKPNQAAQRTKDEEAFAEDDDEGNTGAISPDQVRTKNEVGDIAVVVPEIEEVGSEEVLEKVGEIMSIIDKVVIVKGFPSQVHNRASDRALDSGTLLVFGDRKVLGHVWETFGPTSQPFYRVQFNEAYPLDSTKVHVGREVFHVPARSKFVFMSHLKLLKGSDASNAHDEEPGDDELEFSDDEAEREHKRALTEKRTGSVVPSRHSTPGSSRVRDFDMADDIYTQNPYDDAYNDMDFSAGPSRPAPVPYDDPYSDSYGIPDSTTTPIVSPPDETKGLPTLNINVPTGPPRGRGRGKLASREGGRDRGRGRGQDRRRGGERDRGRGRGRGRGSSEHWRGGPSPADEYDPRISRPLSPTSLAIARATGQYSDGTSVPASPTVPGNSTTSPPADLGWGYQQYPNQQPFNPTFGYQQPYVQPHINPRFASMFGMNFGYAQQEHGPYSPDVGYAHDGWDHAWNAQNAAPDAQPRDDGPPGAR